MVKLFLSEENSFELKKLGFNEKCLASYSKEHGFSISKYGNVQNKVNCNRKTSVAAPLYQQAFKWFRENYGYSVFPMWGSGNNWNYNIQKLDKHQLLSGQLTAVITKEGTFEEAELDCLNELIKIVKEKNK